MYSNSPKRALHSYTYCKSCAYAVFVCKNLNDEARHDVRNLQSQHLGGQGRKMAHLKLAWTPSKLRVCLGYITFAQAHTCLLKTKQK